MLRFALLFSVASVLTIGLGAEPCRAQNIDEALRLYQDRDYEDAALAFYDVLSNDRNPDNRDQAEIYLAETLRKMKLFGPALFYYQDIFKIGRNNRFYLNAVEGLLKIQRHMHDPIFVPSMINDNLDTEGFAQLDPDKIHHINFLIGELSFRQRKNQDAAAFLSYVPPESAFHPRARYLLGLLEVRGGNLQGALEHFRAIVEFIDADSSNDESIRVRNLGLIGSARAAYGLQQYGKAADYYRQVPRFTEQWFTALYEDAWAQFQQGQHGKALGEVQSVTAPYFAKRHVPEAYVVSATSYFVNCQWDRVRREVERYQRAYQPMLTSIQSYLQAERPLTDFYHDAVKGGAGAYSIELAREVRRVRRFKSYHFMLSHLEWEQKEIASIDEWRSSRLGEDLVETARGWHEKLVPAVGQWVRVKLTRKMELLKTFQNQINILDFEVADAERRWLEQGKEVLKGRRARIPRPEIPNDQWQHWNFDREYWKDELGYIQHAVATECIDDAS